MAVHREPITGCVVRSIYQRPAGRGRDSWLDGRSRGADPDGRENKVTAVVPAGVAKLIVVVLVDAYEMMAAGPRDVTAALAGDAPAMAVSTARGAPQMTTMIERQKEEIRRDFAMPWSSAWSIPHCYRLKRRRFLTQF